MSDFRLMGGVGIMGVLTPMDSRDTYAVVDPVYGIDGLRNVPTIKDLHNVPPTRRRAGMIVGVNGGESYFKLKNSNWKYDLTDWEVLTLKINHIDREIPSGRVNNINRVFTLTQLPELQSEHLFLNGLLQDPGETEDYIISGNTITFIDPPFEGSKIRCSYRFK
tara:strand:- start:309 stop:800 length:492 start_codon:yes stop_codon:yes gene_type:complete